MIRNVPGAPDIDVYQELKLTKYVPCVKSPEGAISYGIDVQEAIMKFIQLGGYADLRLGQYLDELYDKSTSF